MPTHPGLWNHVGEGYFLVNPDEVFVTTSRSITLAPTTTVTVNLISSIFDFTARENYIGFVAEPYGKFLQANGHYSGVTSTDQLILHTNTGLQARAFVSPPRSSGNALHFITDLKQIASPFNIEVTSANTATLEMTAHDVTGQPADCHIQFHTYDLAWNWSPHIVDLPAGATRIIVSPHHYRLVRAVKMYDSTPITYWLELNQIAINPQAGDTLQLSMGGALQPVILPPETSSPISQRNSAYTSILCVPLAIVLFVSP